MVSTMFSHHTKWPKTSSRLPMNRRVAFRCSSLAPPGASGSPNRHVGASPFWVPWPWRRLRQFDFSKFFPSQRLWRRSKFFSKFFSKNMTEIKVLPFSDHQTLAQHLSWHHRSENWVPAADIPPQQPPGEKTWWISESDPWICEQLA